jgi:hypothetical protein
VQVVVVLVVRDKILPAPVNVDMVELEYLVLLQDLLLMK